MDHARTIRLTARAEASLRCAWCHSTLAERDPAVACPRCRTRFHATCAGDRCPTLGCGTRPARELDPIAGCVDLFAWCAAVFLPGACLLLFELSGGGAPTWRSDAFWSWLLQLLAPEALRWSYPLALGSMVAYMAVPRQPSRWREVGLLGGAALGLTFAGLTLLPLLQAGRHPGRELLLPIAAIPLLAVWAYLRAWARARRLRWRAGQEEEWIPHDVWAVLFGASAIQAARTMNELWLALPDQPPSPGCWLATAAAASGHPRLTGAVPVRFRDGQVRPMTRQLRTFKAFELALRALAPGLHRPLRALYDRAGPPLAARLGPRSATATWLLLLPAQLAARLALALLFRGAARGIERTYGARGASSTRALPGAESSTRNGSSVPSCAWKVPSTTRSSPGGEPPSIVTSSRWRRSPPSQRWSCS